MAYTVAFRLHIHEADAAAEAATITLDQMQPGCPASIFLVRDNNDGEIFEVDFTDCEPEVVDDDDIADDVDDNVEAPGVATAARQLWQAIANFFRGVLKDITTDDITA